MADAIEYDFIGRLEDFDKSIAFIKAKSNLPDVPVVHRNRGRGKLDITVTGWQKRMIEEIYRADFERYNY